MNLSSQKTSIAHIDHSYFFRQGLKQSIRQTLNYDLKVSTSEIVGLLKKMNLYKIDIVLLGDLGDEISIDVLIMEILNINPNTAIIAFQSITNFDRISQMIKKGIKGFISKNLLEEDFFRSLMEVRINGFFFNSQITRDLIELVQNEQKLSDSNLTFSAIEKQILELVSNGCIAEEISKKLNKSKKTIEGYRYRMLKKAKVKNIAELVAWGFRNKILN